MHNMLIVGESSSGKTNLVQTILLSLMERYTPGQVNFFILDFSSKLLTRFRPMPHCSAVLTDDDEPAIDRLFEMVSNEIKRRQKLFAQAEVNSYEAYCTLHPLPLVLVIIDGLVNFTSIKKGNLYYSTIHEYMRDGAGYGVKFILAGSHYNEFSMRVRQEAGIHLGMNLKDRYAYYDVMGVKSDYVPPAIPGRGLCLWDGRPLEFQTAIFSLEEDPKVSAQQLQDVLQRIQARDQGCTPAPKLSMLSDTETYDDFCKKFAPGRIPLGYTVDSIKAVSLPLKQMFTTAVYFGNKLGIAPVMDNLLYAYCAEHMELLIVKRSHGTLFAEDSERVRFGGQLDKAGLVVLPKTYMSVTTPAERYNRFVMHYNGKLTGMMMPCGELLKHMEMDMKQMRSITENILVGYDKIEREFVDGLRKSRQDMARVFEKM